MIVGVLRETAPAERRVALTPDQVRELGCEVLVERSAGARAGFPDARYRDAGAEIVDRSELLARAELVAWVKPPVYQLDSLRPGAVTLGFQDPMHRAAAIAELSERAIESVGFETVPHHMAEIDALSAMSRIAGSVAYSEGRQLISGADHRNPVRALIIGCGQAGLAAVAEGAKGGDEIIAMGNRPQQARLAAAAGADHFILSGSRCRILTATPDLIICAAVRRGERGPVLLDETVLAALPSGTVIVDLVAKSGGNCAGVVPDRTVMLPNGVIITHRSNYPAARPQEASLAYGAAVAAMIHLRVARRNTP
ncbi:hypothetical protein D5S18_13870 [Nocardia panacis]|uniref:proton-translocating NAD(P)(+) transhydrogenase n=1 Tax=Nocardia panacis TaxID=2340916 RepID=A0A3A4KC56_9NOCA|nr:hypothetical protein [Nocardia panacis]RJO75853.1 hypothetical protein D5S18_13870 [Nocardia panacis]